MVKPLIAWLKKLAAGLGKIQTTLILGIFYYFLVTPFGLVFQLVIGIKRLFIKNPDTYWQPREPEDDIKNAYQQF
ncbi:MAG: hypothetical protein UX85_C0005G0062 [Candidatus Beckwithbacteria bacterium GW2011_GWB1_47_15]|uniref:Uncharacterized protein n=1 Tax=Candidatus Beckwithbacteria bacterium GW2011_GWB1_47_15 TaxID=1618371 RepID=A0A0G1RUM5_9BACT|nr:MAG: hypothetical protein UY43_C0001G0792 [Candidatus Beckwithbacteria bacterium GW2011_GWC1_49_16]KKU35770.1 MAG: hypothetical protein UX50_C0002G0197 [Candidatus Beckwithbacteria bacterium GW2011_GWA1_46_30]KKU61024.1 MAG: hypothetical protein UX85_C0005G0062 [Candidatus Beckwithbacteria bacterium GW2011_GWB1_47_15]KKU72329.1 MAG: hypothetical protein UX97_C0001G0199 [Candidatus Beckwithbacteria bacterium GW2011_GWA2_47_25]KKW04911.1 MAG: hypothetical protein UY37_C0001G0015 [Candidatus Be